MKLYACSGQHRSSVLLFLGLSLTSCGGGGGGGGGATPSQPTKWLVMVYMAGDNSLEPFVPSTINAMESIPASSSVTIAVQEDTRALSIKGTATCKRIVIQPDADQINITSPTIQDLGEINSASVAAIESFVMWATSTYPSDRYVLILWDHGGHWQAWGEDVTNNPGNLLTFQNLKTLFQGIQSSTGIGQFDLIGFDACLMAGIEIDQLLSNFARFRIASCEVEFALGGQSAMWDYGAALGSLVANPEMSVPNFGQAICDSFINQKNAVGIGNQTLSLVDLVGTPALVVAVDSFSQSLIANLGGELIPAIAGSRRYAPEYGVPNRGSPGIFVDLREFASLVESSTASPGLATAAAAVVIAVDSEVAYRVQGSLEPGHGGVSIYFPNGADDDANQPEYADVDFAGLTQWDSFIAQYQTALGADINPPSVTINSPPSGSSVSSGGPVVVNFTATGTDLYDVSSLLTSQVSATEWRILGHIDFGSISPGTYNFTWNAQPFVIWDGVAPFADFLCAGSSKAGTGVYQTSLEWSYGTGSIDVTMFLELNWATGAGSILGAYIVVPAGAWISAPIEPGHTLRVRYPVLDITTSAISYETSSVVLTVPPGGLSDLLTYRTSFGSGTNHDLFIIGEDYAGNFGVDFINLNVP